MKLKEYARKILSDAGCDCYTYGGEFSKHIMSDLKEAFPDGMEYPYIDVANAILKMSRPTPIKRSPYLVHWDTDSCSDAVGCDSYESALCAAEDCYNNWMIEESHNWKSANPTEEEKESWDDMIYNCGAWVSKYNPNTDEYETCKEFTQSELDAIGWKLFEED